MIDIAQTRRDLVYLLPGLAIGLVTFVTLVTGVLLGLSLVVVWVGLPVLVAMLVLAKAYADLERLRVRAVTAGELPPTYYKATTGIGPRRFAAVLTDPQRWRDVLHGILVMPLAVFTWSVTVIWTTGAIVGLTYPLYGWVVPRYPDSQTLPDMIGLHGFFWDALMNVVLGTFFLVTGPRVLRALAFLHTSFARKLLTNETAALRARAEQLTVSRSAAVQAEAQTLRRVERDLHDGPQQRLARLTMDLEAVRRRIDNDPETARTLVDEAITQSHEALSELRAVSRGIAPPILLDRGLTAALAAAVGRCPVPATLDCELADGQRLPEAVENAAYFTVSEALTNVAKHSRATRATVQVTLDTTGLWLQITDDGIGGAHLGKGHGLAGLTDRLTGVDGRLDVHSPEGGPTVLTAQIPVTR
ncbi:MULTISPECIES: sensor histidine kinase [unclassified Nocardia]|uniref:sensor histidine kinase n=1 Tax=unclassified Nocardia TaxID=2637762 RepID=UPI001CE40C5A|nr:MULTISPECIES: sensor histidine kinase [unclassified Nocardia]